VPRDAQLACFGDLAAVRHRAIHLDMRAARSRKRLQLMAAGAARLVRAARVIHLRYAQ
jgi:hypothetical protein